MDIKALKQSLSLDDVYQLLDNLNGDPKKYKNHIESLTICHGGKMKRKLFYYDNSKLFVCYNECGTMDIIELLQNVLHIDFTSAVNYLCKKFNINTNFTTTSDTIDMSFIDKFNQKDEIITYNPLDSSILDSYYNLYHKSWYDDGISKKVMDKYDIKFSISDNQIIIPHHDINGELIGIRCRNLNKELLDRGCKYMPVIWHGEQLNHSLGGNLYGLYQQLDRIKYTKTIILAEAEKSTLQANSFKYMDIPVLGECGSTIHQAQINLLIKAGVENVILGLDKEFKQVGDTEEQYYIKKINETFIKRLRPYFNLDILWDLEGLLDYKNSPFDKGEEVFNKLYKKRIIL